MQKRIVFVTGATSGIGEACARKFAANGDDLIITGRRAERLEALKEELEKNFSVKVRLLNFDVRDQQAVAASVASFPEEWKKVDILVNNAGLAAGLSTIDEGALDDWETMIDTNVKGLLYVSRAVIPLMKARGWGQIINIGSTAGKDVYPKGNVYCATKFAVDALSKAMRIDLLPHHIRVTAIHPGAVETEFSIVRFKGDEQKAKEVYKGFAPLSGEDIAETIFFCTTLPPHACINDLVITPTAQANAHYIYREEK